MKFLILLFVSLSFFSQARADYQANGFVTPAEVTINFKGISLIKAGGGQKEVLSGDYPVTFRAADDDLSSVTISDITIPAGRYTGISLANDGYRTLKIAGYKYEGPVTDTANGKYLCSTGTGTDGTGLTSQNTSSECTDPTDITINYNPTEANSGDRQYTTFTYFPGTYCVDTDQNNCTAGDIFVDANVPENLQVNILLDLYGSVKVATNLNSTDAGCSAANPCIAYAEFNLFALFGTPGAAMHLTYPSAGAVVTEVELLFDSNQNLIYADASSNLSTSDFCSGRGQSSVTAVPDGKTMGLYGSTNVAQYDPDTGKLAVAMSGAPTTDGEVLTWPAEGMNLFGDLRNPAGTSVSVKCVADSDDTAIAAWDSAFSAYLGYTYTAGAGVGSTGTLEIKKVSDPNDVLGIATCGSSVTTGCGAYPQ